MLSHRLSKAAHNDYSLPTLPGDCVGVVLLHWGGPDAPQHVDGFLRNVYMDPELVRLPGGRLFRPWFLRAALAFQRKTIHSQFNAVGGFSPAIHLAEEQARGLENLLQHRVTGRSGVTFRVYMAMHYWHPFACETAHELEQDGVRHLILIPGFLQHFKAGTSSAFARWDALTTSGEIPRWPTARVESYATHPEVLRAINERIDQTLQRFPRSERAEVTIVFVAAGVPGRTETSYYRQVHQMADGVMRLRGEDKADYIAYYGHFGPINGKGPNLIQKIEVLAHAGQRNILIVPLCGITDTLHTTHFFDIVCRKHAAHVGIRRYEVARALNSHGLFLEVLAKLVVGCLDLPTEEPASVLAG